jgi:hypothetical protein
MVSHDLHTLSAVEKGAESRNVMRSQVVDGDRAHRASLDQLRRAEYRRIR